MQQFYKSLFLMIVFFSTGCVSTRIIPNPTNTQSPQPFLPQNTSKSNMPLIPTTTSQSSTATTMSTLTTAPIKANPTNSPEPIPTLSPDTWMNMPIVPEISDRVVDIYLKGLELGNNPRAFSKIGDCGSTPAWFLGNFDSNSKYYSLGEHQYLEPIIQEFHGSYERTSIAAKSGFNASSIFAPIWASRDFCQPGESPLECEYRLHQPMFAFITLGTNDIWHQEDFEPQMRKIIETSIENGIIPILSTKADNLEGDNSINATIAKLAVEYEIPLWNYWLAVQPLPNHGLQKDGAHLTWGPTQFDDPKALQTAWTIRNLTALQVLNAVWQEASAP
jgi:hypothetical protein